ncbi:enoyl-CoA hydratase [Bacillus coahuilensis]|uniref:enoyl-CoA hydratase n=1 Tax=Bacillus coahuilensis TaxID=408580 RepID=UPI0001850B99|nr:enoyl-CoA hydratase [Bacillus coahuilensis]
MVVQTSYETIKVEVSGAKAVVTLNRPKSLNAMNVQLMKELAGCLQELSKDREIKLVVMKGAGGAFSSGGDIKEMLVSANEKEFGSIMDSISQIAITLYSMPKVTVAAIHGAAAGLGLSLALASDYVIAEENSKLAMNFIGIGLIPDGGGHFFMEQRLGPVKAKQFIWEGRVIEGQEAFMKGLIDEVVAEGRLEESLERFVTKTLHSPLKAKIKTKQIITEAHRPALIKVLEHEKEGQFLMRQTEDHQEGVKAFIEKRKPNFTGH